MTSALKNISPRKEQFNTPATQKATKGQKPNNGGGYSFVLKDGLQQAQRFLILGSEGSYYESGAKLSTMNADNLIKLIKNGRSNDLVDLIVEISTQGRAPKQQPGLFALAVASSYGEVSEKQYALSKLPQVARTASTLFEFVAFALQFRSWGRALKNAVADWYTSKAVDSLAFQVVKYGQREGWTHGDILRLTHAKSADEAFNALAQWAIRETDSENLPEIVKGFMAAKNASSEKNLIDYINEYNLTWEMIPSEKRSKAVWQVLVRNGMPLGALIRQLPTLTRNEILVPNSKELNAVVAQLKDKELIERARIHPINVLQALKTYEAGRSDKGSSTWRPVQRIVDALNETFYLAFKNVEPTGKNFLFAVDVSGSMSSYGYGASGRTGTLTPAEVAAALALVGVATEENSHVVGFATQLVELPISPRMRLDQVLRITRKNNFGSTNPSAAIDWAIKTKTPVDTFVVITDNDVNNGRHANKALAEYRQKTGIDAKLVVLAVTASKFSIADPNDPGMLDIAGFDSAVPQLIAEFSKGF